MLFEYFTQGYGWFFAAIIAVLIGCSCVLTNQYLKYPGSFFVFWVRFSIVLMLAPMLVLFEPPKSVPYYLAVLISSFSVSVSSIISFNIAAKYGSGVLTRLMSLCVFTVFVSWLAFDHELLMEYINAPIKFGSILLCIFGSIYFSMQFRKCDVSQKAFMAVLPAIIASTITMFCNKFAMEQGGTKELVFYYIFIQSSTVLAIVTSYMYLRSGEVINFKRLYNKKIAMAGFILAALSIVGMMFKNISMISIPNPAYFSIVNHLSPVFIAAFYWMVKHKEQGDVRSGFGIVFCATAMLLINIYF